MNKNGLLPYQFFLVLIIIMLLYYWYGFNKYQNNVSEEDLYLSGISSALSGSFETAREDFENILKVNPEHTGAKIGKEVIDDAENNRLRRSDASAIFAGLNYGNTGDWNSAISEFERVSQNNPQYAHIYFIKGVAYFHNKMYDGAILNYNKTAKLCPEYYDAYFNKGVIYEQLGEIEKAVKSYKKFVRYLPKKEIVRVLRMKQKIKNLEKRQEQNLFPVSDQ